MSKKTLAQDRYDIAEDYYRKGKDSTGGSQEIANDNTAAMNFWLALCFGHLKAPYALYACFGQGIGVKQDDNIATLMFGIALKLGDERCEARKMDVVIPSSISADINNITQLVLKSNAANLDVDHFDTQMELFGDAFHLPYDKKIVTCFIEKYKEESSHNFDNNSDVS